MDKHVHSIGGRLVLYLLYSLLSACVATSLLFILIREIYYKVPLPSEINYFVVSTYAKLGILSPFLICAFILMFFFYIVWISKFSAYFTLISKGVQQLSEGKFKEVHIPVKGKNGLSILAKNITIMQDKLSYLIEEEKKAVQSQQELVTNVSHDLRTPLTSIIGYLRLIEEDQYRDEVELRYFTSIAYEKSNRLNRMVHDLFEYTKINNQNISLKIQAFNVIELLHQLSTQFYPELTMRNMSIQILSDSGKVIVRADADKLMRVFENLLSNAIKYGESGTLIKVVVTEDDSFILTKVVNQGNPIPTSALPFIFNRMYRVEQSRSVETGGTGLGLAIAKGIVDLHHGEILAYSNEIETVFQVKLPQHAF